MKRYKTIGFLVGAAILTSGGIASAQRWGREAVPRSGVCFYENNNFEGRYFCSPAGATRTEVPSGTNDMISSVRVFGDAAVTVFRDGNFRGQAKVIDTDITDLRRMGFNDRISSYRVETSRTSNRGGDWRGDQGADWRRDQGGDWRDDRGNDRRGIDDRDTRGGQANGRRWNQRDAEAVVRRSYQAVLGRDPDESGLRSWTEQVMRNNWTQRDLENELRNTDEFRTLRRNDRRR